MPRTKSLPVTRAALNGSPATNGNGHTNGEANGHQRPSLARAAYAAAFRDARLAELPGIAERSAIRGALHLTGLLTVGDVLDLGSSQAGACGALIGRGFMAEHARAAVKAVERYWQDKVSPVRIKDPWEVEALAAGPAEPTPAKPAIAVEDLPIEKLPLEEIVPCPLNPRKTFNAAKLAELADTIRRVGVLQPILVRRCRVDPQQSRTEGDDAPGGFELIFGERRFRASAIAGRPTIPARVVDWDDAEVLEVMVIENGQRDDVPPLEEAEGYQQLLDLPPVDGKPRHTVESIAQKVGKSTSTIYQLLKLQRLPAAAKAALAEDKIPVELANLIARVPGKAREDAAKRILKGNEEWSGGAGGGWFRAGPGPMTVRDARSFLEAKYMKELKGTPFDRKSLDLVASAGACNACPKLTGNNRADYPDARADVCTDPECYRAKVDAHNTRNLQAFASKPGYKVFSSKAAEKVQSYDHHNLDARCYEDRRSRTYRQLLKEAIAGGKVQVLVRVDPRSGSIEELVPREGLAKHLRGKVEKPKSARGPSPASVAKDREAAELYDTLKLELMRQSAEAAEVSLRGPQGPELLGELLGVVIRDDWSHDDDVRVAINRRCPEGREPKSMMHGDHGPAIKGLLGKLDLPKMGGFLAELLAARYAPSRYARYHGNGAHLGNPEASGFFKAVGLDPGKVLAELKAEAGKKQKADKKPAKAAAAGKGR